MLLLSPLVGYSFIQAVALYAEASRPALSIPEPMVTESARMAAVAPPSVNAAARKETEPISL